MDKNIAISKNEGQVLIYLRNFRAKEDGTNDCEISYDNEFLEMVKSHYKIEKPSKVQLSEFISLLVGKATNGIDGYKMTIEDKSSV